MYAYTTLLSQIDYLEDLLDSGQLISLPAEIYAPDSDEPHPLALDNRGRQCDPESPDAALLTLWGALRRIRATNLAGVILLSWSKETGRSPRAAQALDECWSLADPLQQHLILDGLRDKLYEAMTDLPIGQA